MLPAKLTKKTTLSGLTAGVLLSSLVAVLLPGPIEMVFLLTAGVLVVLSLWTARLISVFRHQRTPMAWFWGVLTALWWLVVGAGMLASYTSTGPDHQLTLLTGVVVGGFVVLGAGFFSVGFFIRALTQSQLERRALAQDQTQGLVVLPANRSMDAPARRTARVFDVLAGLGVAGLVGWPIFGILANALGGSGRFGMSVGAWLVIVAGVAGLLRKPNVFSAQRSMVFSPWAATRDAILPWMGMWLLGFWAWSWMQGEASALMPESAFFLWGFVLLFQGPWMICLWEHRRWARAWKDDASSTLPQNVRWSVLSGDRWTLPVNPLVPQNRLGGRLAGRPVRESTNVLHATFPIEALDDLRFTPIAATEQAALPSNTPSNRTGDPDFDKLFHIEGSPLLVRSVFDARVRQALVAAHPFGVTLTPGLLRCGLEHPWRTLGAAAALEEARAALLATVPPADTNHKAHLRARLLQNALGDPHAWVRLVCAGALLEHYLNAPETLYLLSARLDQDLASVGLMRQLDDLLSPTVPNALIDDSPWPTPDSLIAQMFWCVVLENLPDPQALWVLSPPRGRLTNLSLDLSVRVVVVAGRVRAEQAEPLALSVWEQPLSDAQRQDLCHALAHIGSHACLQKLNACAAAPSAPPSLVAAARRAAAAIVQRLGLSPGELSLASTDESGALSIT